MEQETKTKWTKGVRVAIIIIGISLFLVVSGVLKGSPSQPTTTQPVVDNTPKLELFSFNCDSNYGYFTISGQVKNISGQSLKNVEAVGTTYTKNKEFINSDASLIEYDPILAGQTSPFKVMMTDNPAMTKCGVDFKYLMGGSINFKDDTTK